MASTPSTCRRWCLTGEMTLTGGDKWTNSTNTPTSKPPSKVRLHRWYIHKERIVLPQTDFLFTELPIRHWYPLPACEAQEGATGNHSHSSDNGAWLARLFLWVLWVDSSADRTIRPTWPCVWGGVSLHSRVRFFWSTTQKRWDLSLLV